MSDAERTNNEIYNLVLAVDDRSKRTEQLALDSKAKQDTSNARVLVALGAIERHDQLIDKLSERVTEHEQLIGRIQDEISDIKMLIKLTRKAKET